MGDIAKNFNKSEFMCKCGCMKSLYNERFLEKLQTLRDFINKPIYITSGYRCSTHDKNVGGTGKGTHTLGIAVDCYVNNLSSKELAQKAEILGFGGIGLIDDKCVHIDMRDETGHGFAYANNKWYGDERTNKTFLTFKE